MKYAVIKTGGKQYRVSEGDILSVERLTTNVNDTVTFPDVLLFAADDAVKIGQPVVEGLTVSAKVLEHVRGEKIRVAKFKAKARYRRVTGHRQELTKIQIEAISDGKAAKATKPAGEKETVVAKKPAKKAAAK